MCHCTTNDCTEALHAISVTAADSSKQYIFYRLFKCLGHTAYFCLVFVFVFYLQYCNSNGKCCYSLAQGRSSAGNSLSIGYTAAIGALFYFWFIWRDLRCCCGGCQLLWCYLGAGGDALVWCGRWGYFGQNSARRRCGRWGIKWM